LGPALLGLGSQLEWWIPFVHVVPLGNDDHAPTAPVRKYPAALGGEELATRVRSEDPTWGRSTATRATIVVTMSVMATADPQTRGRCRVGTEDIGEQPSARGARRE
jgi:hypothetical protein